MTLPAGDSSVVKAYVGYFAKSRSYDHEYLEVAGRPLASLFLLLPEGLAGVPAREFLTRPDNLLVDLMRDLREPGDDVFLHGDRAPVADAPPSAPLPQEQFERAIDGYVADYVVGPRMLDPQGVRWRRLRDVIHLLTVVGRYSEDTEMMHAGPPKLARPLCRVLSSRRAPADLVAGLERVCARRGMRIEQARGQERLPLWRPW